MVERERERWNLYLCIINRVDMFQEQDPTTSSVTDVQPQAERDQPEKLVQCLPQRSPGPQLGLLGAMVLGAAHTCYQGAEFEMWNPCHFRAVEATIETTGTNGKRGSVSISVCHRGTKALGYEAGFWG